MVAVAGCLGVRESLAVSFSWLDRADSIAAICNVADMLWAMVLRARKERLGLVAARDPLGEVVDPSWVCALQYPEFQIKHVMCGAVLSRNWAVMAGKKDRGSCCML